MKNFIFLLAVILIISCTAHGNIPSINKKDPSPNIIDRLLKIQKSDKKGVYKYNLRQFDFGNYERITPKNVLSLYHKLLGLDKKDVNKISIKYREKVVSSKDKSEYYEHYGIDFEKFNLFGCGVVFLLDNNEVVQEITVRTLESLPNVANNILTDEELQKITTAYIQQKKYQISPKENVITKFKKIYDPISQEFVFETKIYCVFPSDVRNIRINAVDGKILWDFSEVLHL